MESATLDTQKFEYPLITDILLRIRLSRTGKKGQPSFRIVVAEKTRSVKRKYLELLGHYLPATNPKKLELKKDRIEYWISKGAEPSDSVAVILKNQGFSNMEQFIEPRDKKRRKKGEQPEPPKEEAAKEAAPAKTEAPAEAPAEPPKEEAAA